MIIDIWSDYVCPFCYLEIPVTDRLQRDFGAALRLEWHAFELRPEPVPTLDPAGEYLQATWARAVYPMAESRDMKLRLPPLQPRSRKALEAAEFARQHERFDAMHRALFRAFFEDGRDIGNVAELLDIGSSVGLASIALAAALEDNRHAGRVLQDEVLAQQLGITAVPTLLVRRDGEPLQMARALSGAISYEHAEAVVAEMLPERNA